MPRFLKKIVCQYCDGSAECTKKKELADFIDKFWTEHDKCGDFVYLYRVTVRNKKGGVDYEI